MTGTAIAGFVLAAVLITITPGLDTMLVLRNVLLGGRRAGALAMAGIITGCLVWGLASVLGLTALLTASRVGYGVLRFCGAAYLLWLGGSALVKSIRRGRDEQAPVEQAPAAPVRPITALRSGLVTNLLNPKVGAFYLSLLPQFLPTSGSTTGWAMLLVLIQLTVGAAWLAGLIVLATRARAVLSRARVRRWLDRISALVLVGFGVRVALTGP